MCVLVRRFKQRRPTELEAGRVTISRASNHLIRLPFEYLRRRIVVFRRDSRRFQKTPSAPVSYLRTFLRPAQELMNAAILRAGSPLHPYTSVVLCSSQRTLADTRTPVSC